MKLIEMNNTATTLPPAFVQSAATTGTPPLPLGEGWRGRAVEGDITNQVYNVAVGDRTTLNQLYEQLHLNLLPSYPHLQSVKPVYRDFRAGDVRHSLADISKAATLLSYQPTHRIGEGLKVAMDCYVRHVAQQPDIRCSLRL